MAANELELVRFSLDLENEVTWPWKYEDGIK